MPRSVSEGPVALWGPIALERNFEEHKMTDALGSGGNWYGSDVAANGGMWGQAPTMAQALQGFGGPARPSAYPQPWSTVGVQPATPAPAQSAPPPPPHPTPAPQPPAPTAENNFNNFGPRSWMDWLSG